MNYDDWKLETDPAPEWYCDYCGCRIKEEDVTTIPTGIRYVNNYACPECAKEEIEKQTLINQEYE